MEGTRGLKLAWNSARQWLEFPSFEIRFRMLFEKTAQLVWHLPGVREATGWINWDEFVIRLPKAYKGYFFLLVGEGLRHSGWVRLFSGYNVYQYGYGAHGATKTRLSYCTRFISSWTHTRTYPRESSRGPISRLQPTYIPTIGAFCYFGTPGSKE